MGTRSRKETSEALGELVEAISSNRIASQEAMAAATVAVATSEQRANAWYSLATLFAAQGDADRVEAVLPFPGRPEHVKRRTGLPWTVVAKFKIVQPRQQVAQCDAGFKP